MKFVLLLALAVCVSAESLELQQNSTNSTNTTTPPNPFANMTGFGPQAMTAVAMEEMMARTYLDVVLKFQHSTQASMAGMLFSQIMMMEHQEDGRFASFEEKETLFTEEGFSGSKDFDQAKTGLLAAYYLYSANKFKFYQAVFKAGDTQQMFWKDRAIQLFLMAAAPTLPPQVIQLGYLKVFRTNLETIKMALNFQYISHFVTWLEDEMDVLGTIVDPSNPYQSSVVSDQGDDLIAGKMYAFTAYNSYAVMDFQAFVIDTYFESLMGTAMAGSFGSGSFGPPPTPTPTATTLVFLEEEVEVEELAEPTQTQSFGPGANPLALVKIYKFWYMMFQMNAARSGLTSAYAEKLSFDEYDENSEQYKTFAQQMFAGYATNLFYMAQMEKLAAVVQLFMMYAPMMAQGGSI